MGLSKKLTSVIRRIGRVDSSLSPAAPFAAAFPPAYRPYGGVLVEFTGVLRALAERDTEEARFRCEMLTLASSVEGHTDIGPACLRLKQVLRPDREPSQADVASALGALSVLVERRVWASSNDDERRQTDIHALR